MLRSYSSQYIILITVCLLHGACDSEKKYSPHTTLSGFTMGTNYTVKIYDAPESININKLKKEIDWLLKDINSEMSTNQEDSKLSQINKTNTSDWIELSGNLYTVINTALKVSQLTSGAFDITVGPIVNLWGFGPQSQLERIPSDETLDNMHAHVGYEHLQLRKDPFAIKKDKQNMYIDLSGIAKGFGVDEMARYLEHQDIRNYMVEIGGEIKANGVNPQKIPWQIGIEKPVSGKRVIREIIKLENIAMATSGTYRNYFEKNGIRYSHTIDPKTGKPVTHKLASVTVLHKSTMYADALATALLVMDPDSGFKLATRENWAVMFIVKDNNEFVSTMTAVFKELQK